MICCIKVIFSKRFKLGVRELTLNFPLTLNSKLSTLNSQQHDCTTNVELIAVRIVMTIWMIFLTSSFFIVFSWY